jgi:hypothetical protein
VLNRRFTAGVDNSPGCASAFSPLHNAGKINTVIAFADVVYFLIRHQDYALAVPSFPTHFAQTVCFRSCS